MTNQEIRGRIKETLVPQWKIASKLGVCEMTFIRWLRFELSQEKKEMILLALDEIVQEEK